MNNKLKIHIIENQYSQFTSLSKHLKRTDKVEVYPRDEDSYISNISKVKRYLDDRYFKSDKVEDERNDLLNSIWLEVDKADLIMIDYQLIGHSGFDKSFQSNGLKLAKDFKEKNSKKPIIILSHTPRTSEEVLKLSEEYEVNVSSISDGAEEKIMWLEKGYSGQDIGNSEYFKRYLLDPIKKLDLDSNRENSTWLTKIIRDHVYAKESENIKVR